MIISFFKQINVSYADCHFAECHGASPYPKNVLKTIVRTLINSLRRILNLSNLIFQNKYYKSKQENNLKISTFFDRNLKRIEIKTQRHIYHFQEIN